MGPRRIERATETSQERHRGRRALDPASRCWIIKTKLLCGRRGDYLKSGPAGQLPRLPLRNKLHARRVHFVWHVTTTIGLLEAVERAFGPNIAVWESLLPAPYTLPGSSET